jgi:hypothetical protein
MVGIFYAVNTVVVHQNLTLYQNQKKILDKQQQGYAWSRIDLDIKTRLNDLVKYKVSFCMFENGNLEYGDFNLTTWIYLPAASNGIPSTIIKLLKLTV